MKVKSATLIAVLLLGSTFLVSAAPTSVRALNPNLVVNGSFENPVVTNPSGWNIYPGGIPGWSVFWAQADGATFTAGSPPVTYHRPAIANIELQHTGVGDIPSSWTAAQGSQYTELSSDWFGPGSATGPHEPASIGIYQDLSTTPGTIYTLAFAFSARPGWQDNTMFVSWNGLQVAFVSADGTHNSGNVWTYYSYKVFATGSTTRLNFTDDGIPDSYGTFLDAVSVTALSGSGGLSPGYWKNHSGWPAPYETDTLITTIFGSNAPGGTLLGALQLRGGGANALARQAVAALLNAASGPYPLTPNDVISMVTAAFNSGNANVINTLEGILDSYNNL
jgi:hypothetical protein